MFDQIKHYIEKASYNDYHYESITKAPGMFSGLYVHYQRSSSLQQPHDIGTSEELGTEIASETFVHTCHLLNQDWDPGTLTPKRCSQTLL